VPHIFVKPFFLRLDVVLNSLVLSLPLIPFHFNLAVLISQHAQSLDFRRQRLFLRFQLIFNPVDQLSQLLHRLRLRVVQLLFHLRNALNLLFYLRKTLHAFLSF